MTSPTPGPYTAEPILCPACPHPKTGHGWRVVGPEADSVDVPMYPPLPLDRFEAERLARGMNLAYEAGRKSVTQ